MEKKKTISQRDRIVDNKRFGYSHENRIEYSLNMYNKILSEMRENGATEEAISIVVKHIEELEEYEPIRSNRFLVNLPTSLGISQYDIKDFFVDRPKNLITVRFILSEGRGTVKALLDEPKCNSDCVLTVVKANGENDYRDIFHDIKFFSLEEDPFSYGDLNVHTLSIKFNYNYETIEDDATN